MTPVLLNGPNEQSGGGRPEGVFATTHWSVVLEAAGQADSPGAMQALEQLCRTYWYPLYAYARRRGYSAHDAEDLIQGFFAQLLARQAFRERTPALGRFRSFLLASLNYYLADAHDRQHAAKRGGGVSPIALDALSAEERYGVEPIERLTPEKLFERRWALTLVETVLLRLGEEYKDRAELFRYLRPVLFEKGSGPGCEQMASGLDMTAAAVRVALHRMRQRCRELFRKEVARTLDDPSQVEEELRYLRGLTAS